MTAHKISLRITMTFKFLYEEKNYKRPLAKWFCPVFFWALEKADWGFSTSMHTPHKPLLPL